MKDECMYFKFHEGFEPVIIGDVNFNFKHMGLLSDTVFCRIAFNTSFIPRNNTLIFNRENVSPDSVKKDNRFSDKFLV